eukprot:TRINITY_DN435_c2_g5_i1.p1 TRINITY_DN435_c2_g5~~TRINITY_DN435_c2_g5_i1.p1  ORF type:complete len:1432 (+),score=573.01 TRINITY_DN435_c2_g5_i1:2996-7291(+)
MMGFVGLDPVAQRIQGRQVEQGQDGGDGDATHQGGCHRTEEVAAQQRDQCQHGGGRRQRDRAEAAHGGADDGVEAATAGGDVLLDLVHQDHRVAHDDAQHGDGAQHGDEAEGLAEQQQCADHADQAQRGGHHYHHGAAETLQLHHQQQQHGNDHQRHLRRDRGLGLGVFLDRAAHVDAIAHRQAGAQGIEFLVDRIGHVDALHAGTHIGQHRDGGLAVTLPDHAVFQRIVELAERGQRHRAIGRGHGQRRQARRIDTLALRGAQVHADELVALAVLGHGDTGELHGQEVGNLLRAQAQFTGALLVDLEADRALRGLVPVQLHVGGAALLADLAGYLFGNLAHLGNLFATDAELYREAHRRTVLQARQAGAHAAELGAQWFFQRTRQRFAVFHRLGGDHELGKVGAGQLLVQRQVEARRARPHEADDVVDLRAALEDGFHAHGFTLGRLEGSALGKAQVDQQFRPVRTGEELLRHQAEGRQRTDEEQRGGNHHATTEGHAPGDRAPQQLVDAGLVDGMVVVFLVVAGMRIGGDLLVGERTRFFLEQVVAQQGDQYHCRQPGQQQRNGRDLEDGARVFAGAGLGQGDRQEAGHRHQGAGEHREGRAGIGEGGGATAVPALLQLHRHHLDGDDGVVHQQAQRQHQRTQRDLVQADVEHVHEQRGHRQHDGNRNHHHHAGTDAQRYQADHQHDGHRFGDRLKEIVHRFLHRVRHAGDCRQCQPRRQALAQFFGTLIEGVAQADHVAARLHGHADAQHRLAVEAHGLLLRFIIATGDGSDITQAEITVVDVDDLVFDGPQVLELPGGPHIDAVAAGGDEATRHHAILAADGIGQLLRADAQAGHAGIADVDVDVLFAVTEVIDLRHTRHMQQFAAQLVGVVMQLRWREAVSGQCVDVGVDVAEFIVEVRSLDTLRQVAGHIADLLAHLVPGLRHLRGRGRVLDREEQLRLSRTRIAAQEVHVRRLLQLAGDAVGDLLLHLARGGTRPVGLDHHDLEGERRILGLRQARIGTDAQQRHQRQDEGHQGLVLQRPGGEIETAGRAHKAKSSACSGATGLTFSPAVRVCTPCTTILSVAATPWLTLMLRSPQAATATTRSSILPSAPTTHSAGLSPWWNSAVAGSSITGADGEDCPGCTVVITTLPVMPRRRAASACSSVTLTRQVRLCGSAAGPTSRTLPVKLRPGKADSVTVAAAPGAIPATWRSATSVTTSTAPDQASEKTGWPAASTSPVLACSALMTPSCWATRVVQSRWLPATAARAWAALNCDCAAACASWLCSSCCVLTRWSRACSVSRCNCFCAAFRCWRAASRSARAEAAFCSASAGSRRATTWPRRTASPRWTRRSTSWPAIRKDIAVTQRDCTSAGSCNGSAPARGCACRTTTSRGASATGAGLLQAARARLSTSRGMARLRRRGWETGFTAFLSGRWVASADVPHPR